MGITSEHELLLKAQRGDESSFALIYERHREGVFRFAYRMLGSVDAAEDVTQDCFLTLVKGAERFDPAHGPLRNYIYGVARNLSLKHLRNSFRLEPLEDTRLSTMFSGFLGPLGVLLDKELSSQVRDAVTKLAPLQREAIILFEFEELCLVDIASIVDADVGTVKSRLHRARACLKRSLELYFRGALEKRHMETISHV